MIRARNPKGTSRRSTSLRRTTGSVSNEENFRVPRMIMAVILAGRRSALRDGCPTQGSLARDTFLALSMHRLCAGSRSNCQHSTIYSVKHLYIFVLTDALFHDCLDKKPMFSLHAWGGIYHVQNVNNSQLRNCHLYAYDFSRYEREAHIASRKAGRPFRPRSGDPSPYSFG